MKRFLWVEPSARMLQRRLELTWTPNLYGFLPCKSLEVTYGSIKIIFNTKINCFAFSEPKKHHFVCKTTKKSNNFSGRITSAHAIISCCHGKYQNPNDFRALPKTHLKPHFVHFPAFLNIFEQNEWQILFPQQILRLFPKGDFGHWSTPLRFTVRCSSRTYAIFNSSPSTRGFVSYDRWSWAPSYLHCGRSLYTTLPICLFWSVDCLLAAKNVCDHRSPGTRYRW